MPVIKGFNGKNCIEVTIHSTIFLETEENELSQDDVKQIVLDRIANGTLTVGRIIYE